MAHKKKRTDTTMAVYKYGANPLEELPESFWQTAKDIQFVWNRLVGMRNKLTENFVRLGFLGDRSKEREKYWSEFNNIWKEFLKSSEVASILGSDERDFLTQKFEAAHLKAKKEKASRNKKKVWVIPPLRKQFSLDRIYLRHRFRGGGMPVEKFRKTAGKKFSFLFPDSDLYWNNSKAERRQRIGCGVFGVTKDREAVFQFPFSAVIHRELPHDAIIKSVSWVGERRAGSGINSRHRRPEGERDWIWSVDVAIEIPKPADSDLKRGRILAFDAGWRRIEDSRLRIGTCLDSSGNAFNIELPTEKETCSARHGKLICGINSLFEYDSQIGLLVEKCKQDLISLGVSVHPKTREGGLFKLRSKLKESGENPQAVDVLDVFAEEYLPMRSIRSRSFDRMNKYRDWLYQNIAVWMADNYDALVWEGKLGLKKMAEAKKNLDEVPTVKDYEEEKMRRRSARYRNYASLYKFRQYLKQAFAKRGKPVVDASVAYTSRTCSACGEKVEKFANIEFVCPNGHTFDRDVNAASNLLSQAIENFDVFRSDFPEIPVRQGLDLSEIIVKIKESSGVNSAKNTRPRRLISAENQQLAI